MSYWFGNMAGNKQFYMVFVQGCRFLNEYINTSVKNGDVDSGHI